jgi:hypothetical protein
MDIQTKLIGLYCAVCHHYDTTLVVHAQRQSNNFRPQFTDEECIATYIWGICNRKFEVKACYAFIRDYYGEWFPDLPSCQAYNKRICYLSDTFKAFADVLLKGLGLDSSHSDFVNDSMPIVVAGSKRSGRAKVAQEICSKGYCASKDMWYYGLKIHTVAQCNYKALPTPVLMTVTKASEHDLPVAKEMLHGVRNIRLFGDTAFADKEWQGFMMAENNVEILTPIKRKKGQKKLSFWDGIYSTAISSIKQVIESFNNWLIEKTNIQRASKVRSSDGLRAFIFARLACAILCFNS